MSVGMLNSLLQHLHPVRGSRLNVVADDPCVCVCACVCVCVCVCVRAIDRACLSLLLNTLLQQVSLKFTTSHTTHHMNLRHEYSPVQSVELLRFTT